MPQGPIIITDDGGPPPNIERDPASFMRVDCASENMDELTKPGGRYPVVDPRTADNQLIRNVIVIIGGVPGAPIEYPDSVKVIGNAGTTILVNSGGGMKIDTSQALTPDVDQNSGELRYRAADSAIQQVFVGGNNVPTQARLTVRVRINLVGVMEREEELATESGDQKWHKDQ